MVGTAIVNQLLTHEVFGNNLQLITKTHDELDLTDQSSVSHFMASECPDIVIIAAAKVGGIHANNTYPAEFIYQNLMIQNNLIHEGYCAGVKKVLIPTQNKNDLDDIIRDDRIDAVTNNDIDFTVITVSRIEDIIPHVFKKTKIKSK